MERTESIVQESAQAKWMRIIDEHRESGLPVSVFCLERSVSVASYYGWRRKLGGARAKVGFVEAKVVHAIDNGEAKPSSIEPGAAGVRIELTGGRRVVVSRGFDRRLLVDVIQALEEIGAGS